MNFGPGVSEDIGRYGTTAVTNWVIDRWSSRKIQAATRYLRCGGSDENEDHVGDFARGPGYRVRGEQLV